MSKLTLIITSSHHIVYGDNVDCYLIATDISSKVGGKISKTQKAAKSTKSKSVKTKKTGHQRESGHQGDVSGRHGDVSGRHGDEGGEPNSGTQPMTQVVTSCVQSTL